MRLKHSEYVLRHPQWERIRDALGGEDPVKEKGFKYLPMLGSQAEANDVAQYNNYKSRATWYGASKRTQLGLTGALTAKQPSLEGLPEDMLADARDNLGPAWEPLDHVAKQMALDLVSVGRHALLVDAGQDPDPDGVVRPYIANIPAEDVVHWRYGRIGGRRQPELVILREDHERPVQGDRSDTDTEIVDQWRFLRLGEPPQEIVNLAKPGAFDGQDGQPVYWQEVYRKPDLGEKAATAVTGTEGLVLVEVVVPTKAGGRLWREIPIDVVNAVGGITLDTEDPPMQDLVSAQFAFYRRSADLEWGRHICAIPQPWTAGFRVGEGEKLVVGAGSAWNADDVNAKVGYLEFTGAGLGNLVEGQKESKAEMAVQGARMLEEQPAGVEAMGTVRLRQAGERSVLGSIATNGSMAMTRALQRWASWRSPTFETDAQLRGIQCRLDLDMDLSRMDPAELTALTASLQAGTMSWQTYVSNLQRGKMLPDGVEAEEEARRIQEGGPGRSRIEEVKLLQADVTAGRISIETYLRMVEALGFYPGLDVSAEVEKVHAEKAAADDRLFLQIAARDAALNGGKGTPTPPREEGQESDPADDPADEPEGEAEGGGST